MWLVVSSNTQVGILTGLTFTPPPSLSHTLSLSLYTHNTDTHTHIYIYIYIYIYIAPDGVEHVGRFDAADAVNEREVV